MADELFDVELDLDHRAGDHADGHFRVRSAAEIVAGQQLGSRQGARVPDGLRNRHRLLRDVQTVRRTVF